jgi:hypothetical protein
MPILERLRREVVEDKRFVLSDARPTIAMVKQRYRAGYRALVREVSDSIHLRRGSPIRKMTGLVAETGVRDHAVADRLSHVGEALSTAGGADRLHGDRGEYQASNRLRVGGARGAVARRRARRRGAHAKLVAARPLESWRTGARRPWSPAMRGHRGALAESAREPASAGSLDPPPRSGHARPRAHERALILPPAITRPMRAGPHPPASARAPRWVAHFCRGPYGSQVATVPCPHCECESVGSANPV